MLAILFVLASSSFLQAEPTPPAPIEPQSSHIFRALLRNRGLEPTAIGISGNDWSDTVLVLFGPIAPTVWENHFRRVCRTVIDHGGALLIASDGKLDCAGIPPIPLGLLQIDGRTLEDTGNCYRRDPAFPFLRFQNPPTVLDVDVIQMAKLKAVATNQPSVLLNVAPRLEPFGEFSSTSRIDGKKPNSRIGMALLPAGRGICVVISDAGVLANQWLVPSHGEPKLDNYEFAYHLVNYLVKGPNRTRQRTRCIFVDDGKIVDNFDGVQLSPSPPEFRPPWAAIQKTLAENAENKINELQDRDFPTKELVRRAGYLSIVQKLAAAAAIIAILAMLRRVWSGRVPKVNPSNDPTLIAVERTGQLSLAAREKLLRQFHAWGVDQSPQLAVHGSWFYRKRMEKLLNPLINIAFGSGIQAVNRQTWRSFDATIAEIDRELQSGTIQFAERGS